MARKRLDPHYFTIKEFKRAGDDRFWRLHWFGKLDFNRKNLEPLIETTLVPLRDPRLDPEENPPELLDNDSYDFKQSMTVYVGVGQLPLFGHGVFFQHGRPVARPGYTRREFKDLYVGDRTWRNVKAQSRYYYAKDTWGYYIDYDEYNCKGRNPETRFLVVDVTPPDPDGVTKLVIPCLEVIRFHYANSSEMFRELFVGGAAGSPNRVFNVGRTEPPDANGYNGYVQLSKFIRDEDAPIIARMAFDPYALAEANYIYRSMLNNRANKKIRQYIPEARLPFTEARATMVVHGKKVRCGPEHFFLVYWIERCGGPFPFQKFEFERDNSGIKTDPSPRRVNANWPHPPEPEFKTVRDQMEEDVIRSDTDPSRMKKLVERLLARKRFTDLENKSWKKRPKKESKYKAPDVDEVYVPTDEPGEGSSTGPATGTEPVTPLTLITPVDEGGDAPPDAGPEEGGASAERAETLKGGFRLFMQIVTHFHRGVEGMACRAIEVPSRGQPVPRPTPSLFPTAMPGKRLGFSYMRLPNRERRRRQVMVAEGLYRGRYFYLMEIEPQPQVPPKRPPKQPPKSKKKEGPTTFTLFVCYQGEQFTQFDGDDLRGVLAYCASHRGAWLTDVEMTELGKHKIKHGSKSVTRYVERIMEALEDGGLLL